MARIVKEGGVAALSEAERRTDQASYQEIRCRSALNSVKGMPFSWTLNPYRGCTHGCHYRDGVQTTVGMLKARDGLENRRRREENDNPPKEPTSASNAERQASQGELRWS